MDNRILIKQPISPVKPSQRPDAKKQAERNQQASFRDIIQEKINKKSEVKFSKHAAGRLASRNIQLSETDLNKLAQGLDKAKDKGARDSLIMVNQVAYVVSVENKTVITAIDNESVKENVFTNIDSAVFM